MWQVDRTFGGERKALVQQTGARGGSAPFVQTVRNDLPGYGGRKIIKEVTMGRPVFPYELADADFCWLVTNYQDRNPDHISIETPALPVVFIKILESEVKQVANSELIAEPPSEDQVGEDY